MNDLNVLKDGIQSLIANQGVPGGGLGGAKMGRQGPAKEENKKQHQIDEEITATRRRSRSTTTKILHFKSNLTIFLSGHIFGGNTWSRRKLN